MKRITALTATPSFNSVIGIGDARLPLVVEDGCLYTERSRYLEQRVASRLAESPRAPRATSTVAESSPISSRVPARGALSRRADACGRARARRRAHRRHRGPGTGKTLVAAAIVRGFARLGVPPDPDRARRTDRQGREPADRDDRCAARAVASTADADRELVASPPSAQTLHRLLGYRGDGFAHHAKSPLPVGAVIIDEASMIDLELMDALLDALPADVPLVLVGDAHQLPAIDAGQILADLADPDRRTSRRRVALLEHSFRMDADDPRRSRSLRGRARDPRRRRPQAHRRSNGLAIARTPGTLTW